MKVVHIDDDSFPTGLHHSHHGRNVAVHQEFHDGDIPPGEHPVLVRET